MPKPTIKDAMNAKVPNVKLPKLADVKARLPAPKAPKGTVTPGTPTITRSKKK